MRLSTERGSEEAVTDVSGYAAFSELRPGIYRVEIEKAGYIDPADRAGAGRLERFPPSSGARLLIALGRGVVISGQVTDDGGQPVSGMAVSATKRVEAKGQVRFVRVGTHGLTDDSGRYRLHHLPPGSYTVAVRPAADQAASRFRGTVYYPSQSDPSRAEFMDLDAGDEISPIDVRVYVEAPGSVAGVVKNIPNEWQGRRPVVAIAPASGVRTPVAYAYTDASGTFLIDNLPPGEYYALAWGQIQAGDFSIPPEGTAARYSSSPIAVRSSEKTEVNLELAPGIRVEALLAFGAGPRGCSGIESLELRSQSEWPESWAFKSERTRDSIVWESVPPGVYKFGVTQLERSCTFVGVQVPGTSEPPRQVVALRSSTVLAVVTDASKGKVSGTVRGKRQAVSGAMVGLWAARDAAVSAVTETDQNGSFKFDALPPGTYHLLPLGSGRAQIGRSASFSGRHRRQFTLENAQSIQIDLTLDED